LRDQERALAVERAGKPPEVCGLVPVEEAGRPQHRSMGAELATEAMLRAFELLLGAREGGLDIGDPVVVGSMLSEVGAVPAGRFVEPLLERPGGASQCLIALPGVRPGLAVPATARVGPMPTPDPAEREL